VDNSILFNRGHTLENLDYMSTTVDRLDFCQDLLAREVGDLLAWPVHRVHEDDRCLLRLSSLPRVRSKRSSSAPQARRT
jgi:hypothetical protein